MLTLGALEWHVMDSMADDWESMVQILPHVAKYCGTTPNQRIFDILQQIHRFALIRIMAADGYRIDGFPADPRDFWFSMTDSGRELWDAEGHKYRDEA